uniref:UDP-Rhamnose: Flavonol 3-O-glucoside (1->6) rhamnosyltransferase n=1 Tax=Fagopyrum esculentum TaxID=3617 RepID=A0A2Z6IE38_FAGES|nr:UDP-Rhamnose: Flavonol 3-O-glucoside (1->6) rhamnosyltransferase [Fagopyrum esculentum]
MGTQANTTDLHIAVFPYFAFGHINPFVHISNKLASHGIKISFFSAPGNIPRIKSSLSTSPLISIVPLTFPHVDGLPAGFESTADITPAIAELLKVALDKMQPQIRSLLTQLKPDVVFFDFAQNWIPSLASELGIKTVMFSVFSLISNSYLMTPARLSSDEIPTIEELKKPPQGYPNPDLSLKTFQAKDLLYPFRRFNGGPSALERNYAGIQGCDAIAYKSCHEMEGPYWSYFKKVIGKPIIMAGIPIPETSSSGDLDSNWATWLAKFPPKSVTLCSFGSETFLTDVQVQELALGLELTELPFLMVLSSNGFDQERLNKILPEGFLERVKDRGLIHIGWVPQQKIMAHENVGCYVNHAGFGSVIEAIVTDCQLVLLPFKGDQFLNSKLLSLDMKVGVEVNRRDEDGHFGKEDIFEAVRIVTVDGDKEPGKKIRGNLVKWKELLMNKEFEEKYVLELVKEVKALVGN